MSTSTIAASRARSGVLSITLDYLELTKPRIAVLVLVVIVASAVMAAWTTNTPVSGWPIFHACLGTLLVAGSASAARRYAPGGSGPAAGLRAMGGAGNAAATLSQVWAERLELPGVSGQLCPLARSALCRDLRILP